MVFDHFSHQLTFSIHCEEIYIWLIFVSKLHHLEYYEAYKLVKTVQIFRSLDSGFIELLDIINKSWKIISLCISIPYVTLSTIMELGLLSLPYQYIFCQYAE